MLTTDIRDRIAVITLDRPDKRNAFSPELIRSITENVERFNVNEEVRAIVIRGNGPAFSAGADLDYLKQLRSNTLEENEQDGHRLAAMFEAIHKSPKLTFSTVDGFALAGGCGLACVTDFCYASDRSNFGFTEVKIGFVPAIVMVYLLEKVSGNVAKELCLSGKVIDSEEAHRLGLVNQIFESEAFDEAVMDKIKKMVLSTSGEAVASTKKLLHEVMELDHHAALRLAAEQNARARTSKDCIRGMDAFLNKKKISW